MRLAIESASIIVTTRGAMGDGATTARAVSLARIEDAPAASRFSISSVCAIRGRVIAESGAPQVSHLTIQVRFCETDLMGIVHHANYLCYFEAGRVDFLHKRGVSYDSWAKQGVHLPLVSTSLRYRKPARFDDLIVVSSTCAEITRVTVKFTYRVTRGEDLLCEGETLLACVGHTLEPRRIPEEIARTFRQDETATTDPRVRV
jgi:acyl-CoA thioester hydrolase